LYETCPILLRTVQRDLHQYILFYSCISYRLTHSDLQTNRGVTRYCCHFENWNIRVQFCSKLVILYMERMVDFRVKKLHTVKTGKIKRIVQISRDRNIGQAFLKCMSHSVLPIMLQFWICNLLSIRLVHACNIGIYCLAVVFSGATLPYYKISVFLPNFGRVIESKILRLVSHVAYIGSYTLLLWILFLVRCSLYYWCFGDIYYLFLHCEVITQWPL